MITWLKNVAKGNQKVLTAPWRCFYSSMKKTLKNSDDNLKKPETLNFHAKIGPYDREDGIVGRILWTYCKRIELTMMSLLQRNVPLLFAVPDLVTNTRLWTPLLNYKESRMKSMPGNKAKLWSSSQSVNIMAPTRRWYELPSFCTRCYLGGCCTQMLLALQLLECSQVQTTQASQCQVMGSTPLAPFDWTLKLKHFTKLLLGLNYAEFYQVKRKKLKSLS